MRDGALTTGEFAELLWQEFCKTFSGTEEKGPGMATGEAHGWLNAQDKVQAQKPITRSAAARILHEFLRQELGERDAEDVTSAGKLSDLYDCRTCVNHVAQVYCKGIMAEYRDSVFGMREEILPSEAEEMVRRLLSPERRNSVGKPGCRLADQENGAERLSKAEAVDFLKGHPEALHIDVRTPWEYAGGHPEGVRNIPLLQLMEAPERILPDLDAYLLLGCDGGYRSEIAAQRLAHSGYRHIYYYAWGETGVSGVK